MKTPWVVGLVSALFPGLGQFVVGRRERGLAILAGWLVIPALYGIIMVGVEQLASAQGVAPVNLRQFLTGRYLWWGQVELPSLSYAFLGLVLFWLLNIVDAARCAREAA